MSSSLALSFPLHCCVYSFDPPLRYTLALQILNDSRCLFALYEDFKPSTSALARYRRHYPTKVERQPNYNK